MKRDEFTHFIHFTSASKASQHTRQRKYDFCILCLASATILLKLRLIHAAVRICCAALMVLYVRGDPHMIRETNLPLGPDEVASPHSRSTSRLNEAAIVLCAEICIAPTTLCTSDKTITAKQSAFILGGGVKHPPGCSSSRELYYNWFGEEDEKKKKRRLLPAPPSHPPTPRTLSLPHSSFRDAALPCGRCG